MVMMGGHHHTFPAVPVPVPVPVPRHSPAPVAFSERAMTIRTDTHYDPESRVVTVMLEVPGLKKSELSIRLSTAQYNSVRQVTVSGYTRSPLPPRDWNSVRERKHGRFSRSFPVHPDAKVRIIHNSRLTRFFVAFLSSSFFFLFLFSRFCQRCDCLLLFFSCQPEDFDAVLEDGILILKIQCGMPAEDVNEQFIPIQ